MSGSGRGRGSGGSVTAIAAGALLAGWRAGADCCCAGGAGSDCGAAGAVSDCGCAVSAVGGVSGSGSMAGAGGSAGSSRAVTGAEGSLLWAKAQCAPMIKDNAAAAVTTSRYPRPFAAFDAPSDISCQGPYALSCGRVSGQRRALTIPTRLWHPRGIAVGGRDHAESDGRGQVALTAESVLKTRGPGARPRAQDLELTAIARRAGI